LLDVITLNVVLIPAMDGVSNARHYVIDRWV
jgi:hypothetical protein